jgi:hypothetical protein
MARVWKWQAKDKDGKPVESAPGVNVFTSRGPGTKRDLIQGATIMLNSKRMRAVRDGLQDPGYKIDEASIKAEEVDDSPFGQWVPPGAQPVKLPSEREAEEAAVRDGGAQ